MRVCILGEGLVSLTLAKALINQGIYVDYLSDQKGFKVNKSRTIGISKVNLEFLNKNIIDLNKLTWTINKIEIYTDNLNKDKILEFKKANQNLFSIIKNYELYYYLISTVKTNRFFKNIKHVKFDIKNYNLVINCGSKNF